MIKILLLFFTAPTLSWAEDHCTNPDQYTLDKRCYVTDEQKGDKPYSAVVGIVGVSGNFSCTGTIVKGSDEKLYIYTAKHCAHDGTGAILKRVSIKTQKATEITVTANMYGSGDTQSADFAIYSLPDNTDVDSVVIDNKERVDIDHDVNVIGYGWLKIMSDQDIKDFKTKYTNYLIDNKNIKKKELQRNYREYGFVYDENQSIGIELDKTFPSNYLIYLQATAATYYDSVFKDVNKLKVSQCSFNFVYDKTDCQVWSGNSGGGMFDQNGNLVATIISNHNLIGTKKHSKIGFIKWNLPKK